MRDATSARATEPAETPIAGVRAGRVRCGTLDDTSWIEPVGDIWTRSAQPWVTIPSDTLSYEGQPPDMGPMIRAFRERLRA